jgi:hypothetical protein
MTTTTRRLRYGYGLRLACLALAGVVTACGGGEAGNKVAAKPTSRSIQGTMTISGNSESVYFDSFNGKVGELCEGTGGYDDIGPGIQAAVKNETGKLLATGDVGPGEVVDASQGFVVCELPFEIKDVPDSAKFYVVEVGDRGELSYSHEEMVEQGWQLALSLGE